jgi:hypothetical protein
LLDAELEKQFGTGKSTTKVSKVEGSRNGNSGSGGSNSGTSYSDLTAEQKAICERQATKLVGKGRAFATIEAWRTHYAKEVLSE